MYSASRALALSAIAAVLATTAPLAMAATSSSSVLITSFATSTSAGTLTWSDPYQSFSATALNAGGLLGSKTDAFDDEGWSFAIVGATTSNASAGVSTTNPRTFWATADSKTSTGAVTNQPNQGQSTAGQSGSFSLSGAGTVTFTIGYQLSVASPGGNAISDYSAALLAFNLSDSDGSSGGIRNDSLMSFAQASGSASRNGIFTVSVALTAGETGYYNLQGNALAYSSAALPVPEPSSGLLLLAGIAGVAIWCQRRRPTNA